MELHEIDIKAICDEWADARGTSPEVTRAILAHARTLGEAEEVWEDGDEAVEAQVQALADTTGEPLYWGTTEFTPKANNYYSLFFLSPDEAGELHSLDMSGEYAASSGVEAARTALGELAEQCGDGCEINALARMELLDGDGNTVKRWNAMELLEDRD
jgi:hypothetical protein